MGLFFQLLVYVCADEGHVDHLFKHIGPNVSCTAFAVCHHENSPSVVEMTQGKRTAAASMVAELHFPPNMRKNSSVTVL